MRKIFLRLALIAGFMAGGSLLSSRAEAAPIASPAAVQDALKGSMAEQVRYVCQRVWRCGPYGCGWRRSCWYRPNYYGYGYGYRYYAPRRYYYGYRHRGPYRRYYY
jgi:hypothetical protein